MTMITFETASSALRWEVRRTMIALETERT